MRQGERVREEEEEIRNESVSFLIALSSPVRHVTQNKRRVTTTRQEPFSNSPSEELPDATLSVAEVEDTLLAVLLELDMLMDCRAAARPAPLFVVAVVMEAGSSDLE